MQEIKNRKIFTPIEIEKQRKNLLYERLKVLPVDVDSEGYLYDPHELLEALENNQTMRANERKIKK